eukprot:749924-Hanusia_phi.AAC.2
MKGTAIPSQPWHSNRQAPTQQELPYRRGHCHVTVILSLPARGGGPGLPYWQGPDPALPSRGVLVTTSYYDSSTVPLADSDRTVHRATPAAPRASRIPGRAGGAGTQQ